MGDALREIDQLKIECYDHNQESKLISEAARILHKDAKACKSLQSDGILFNISSTQAQSMVPNNVFNFAAQLLTGKDMPVGEDGKVICPDHIEQKSLCLSQHMLYAKFRHL